MKARAQTVSKRRRRTRPAIGYGAKRSGPRGARAKLPAPGEREEKRAGGLPDWNGLTAGLEAVFGGRGRRGAVTVLKRISNVYTSTFPSEIVTCRLADGSQPSLFCKYGPAEIQCEEDPKGGVAYESEVYRRLLQPRQLSVPAYHGTFTDPATGQMGLVLEYVDGASRIQKLPAAMKHAARWIAHFHTAPPAPRSNALLKPHFVYDEAYYLSWVRKLTACPGTWRRRFPWLRPLCDRAREWAALLLQSPQTVIHGEYYPLNILYRRGEVCPIDWESAAVAAGEIDLVSLTEAWPAGIVRQCKHEYRRVRWPEGAPADFERRVAAARMYLAFRWLADGAAKIVAQGNLYYFRELRSAGENLGLIE